MVAGTGGRHTQFGTVRSKMPLEFLDLIPRWGEERACVTSDPSSQAERADPTRRREEVVQGAGMVGPFQAQGAAESDTSDAAEAMSRSAAWFPAVMALPFAASDCP